MCAQVQKCRCRYPQLCPCIPVPNGSPRKERSFNSISPEKTASECGVRENPIQPLLLISARKDERYRRSHEILWPPTSMRPRHSFSPIRFSLISRKKGLAPRLLKPTPPEPSLREPALSKPVPLALPLSERRLSSENPCIHVSGFPSRGNHVAQTCTC